MTQRSNKPFECEKCGLCCSKIPADFIRALNLPVHERGFGCANLREDNTCAIYETRPDICRVSALWENQQKLSWEEFSAESRKACAALQKYYGWKP